MSEADIWRRFYTRTWNDKRVMALSRPTPNGQTLLTHLIAGRQTGIIPGLFEIGERAFAELLGWPLHGGDALLEGLPQWLPKGFREAFAEVSAIGFAKADWTARLVYVPGALKLDPPANPNVVTGWRSAWRSLPECALKDEAEQAFKLFFEGKSKGFGEAFAEVSSNGSRNQEAGSRKQEAGGRKKRTAPAPVETILDAQSLNVTNAQARELFEHWQNECARVHGRAKVLMAPPAALESAKTVIALAGGDMVLAKEVVALFVSSGHQYWADRNWALYLLANGRDFEQARLSAKAKPARAKGDSTAAEMLALREEAIERARKAREAADASA
jgi:hypothetical protein